MKTETKTQKKTKILISQETEKLGEKRTQISLALPVFTDLWNEYKKQPWFDAKIDLKGLLNGNENLILAYKKRLIAGNLPSIPGLIIDEYEALKLYKTPVSP